MNKIQAQTKSVQQLLTGVKYGIDFYQREYKWQFSQIKDILNDFKAAFLECYEDGMERGLVEEFPQYYLGTIITTRKSGKRYIVDGQQRLTTLTLLLVHLHHLRQHNPSIFSIFDVAPLIFSVKSGSASFNIDVLERNPCMQGLFCNNKFAPLENDSLSVHNLAARYKNIRDKFPSSLQGNALPYFVDWVIDNVVLVEIEAQNDVAAFTVFETMNDRGMNLSQAEKLKGYMLANLDFEDDHTTQEKKNEANRIWRDIVKDLSGAPNTDEEEFFKNWLRAKYAQSIRPRKKGAENQDYEKINGFNRWVREHKSELKIRNANEYYEFITQRMSRYSEHYLWLCEASRELQDGNEEIYYNAHINFNLQKMLALAPIDMNDGLKTARDKMRLVAIFLDIYLARRMVNFRIISTGSQQPPMFNLAKAIRGMTLEDLRGHLHQYLVDLHDTFHGISEGHWQPFSLNRRNRWRISYLLARMTAWVERNSGNNVEFLQFRRDADGKALEIEHIWADKFERHSDEFSHIYDFHHYRNYFGGLVLLPKGIHKPLGATSYEEKYKHYIGANLLAASLHAQMYEGKTGFKDFIQRTGLPFKAHSQFKRADLMQRQELYRQICEQIWSPDRLKAI